MWGRGGGLASEIKVSVRGECDKDGWVLSGSVAPLTWWFLVGSVSASVRSVVSRSLVWLKSTIGYEMALISPFKTLCICHSLLMCPVRSDVMAELMGKFTVKSAYSESSSLPQKLDKNVLSL